jgi:hypothetical protein
VTVIPPTRQRCRFVERTGLFEQTCCAWHEGELLFAFQLLERCPVQLNRLKVFSAYMPPAHRDRKRRLPRELALIASNTARFAFAISF